MATPAVAGFAATLLAHDANMSATHVADSITCLSTKGALTDIPFGTLNQLLFAGAAIADEDCINGGPRPPPAPPQETLTLTPTLTLTLTRASWPRT